MNIPGISSQLVSVVTGVPTASSANAIRKPYRGMQIHIPVGSSLTTLTWYSLAPKLGTVHPAKTEASLSVAVTQTGFSAGDSFPMPSDLFGCHTVFPSGNAAGQIEVTQVG